MDPVHDENVIISSTHIRELIKAGFVRRASFELGWVYGFDATVVAGVGRGRSLQFPTANFIPLEKNQLLPGQGVYFTRGRLNSKNIYGMCNLGTRPTFDEGGFVMEVHFFEKIDEELYGRQIAIEFLERIRDEKKFDSAAALTEHVNIHKKDRHTRRGLVMLVAKRRKLMKYLRRTNPQSYVKILDDLSIRGYK